MANELNQRKLTKRFELMDADGNGYLQRNDYEALGRRLVLGFAESPESAKGRAVIDSYVAFWDEFISRIDTDGDGRVGRDEFINWVEHNVVDGDAFDSAYRPHLTAVVDLCDINDDGTVDRGEFTRLLELYGVSPDDASQSFDRIDTDDDGSLTVDEMIEAGRDFYLSSETGTSGDALFGRY
jgi:Ca2+-binding EF-hand superfamily protein